MKKYSKYFIPILFLLFLISCGGGGGGNGENNMQTQTGYLTGINLGYSWTMADVDQLLTIRGLKIVRIPDNRSTRSRIMLTISELQEAGITPLIVFDTANSIEDLKRDIVFYVSKYGQSIYYEVLNEPIAMQGSPGYLNFRDAEDVVNNMNALIDYIHSRIGYGHVLSCGIANVFDERLSKDLLKLVIVKGHQDILSVHVYTCDQASVDRYLPILKWWKKPIWITEIGTEGNKETFYNACVPAVYAKLHPQEVIWFDWNSPAYGLRNVPNFNSYFSYPRTIPQPQQTNMENTMANPARYTYRATLIATHKPGFFSCAWHIGKLWMGTYSTNGRGRAYCQLCTLEGNRVKVVHVFHGESLYHIRPYPGYMFLPIEQGSLFRRNDNGQIIKLKNQKYHMGFYDALCYNGHGYAVEKANIYPPNKVAIYRDGQDWFYSTGWKAKDMVEFNGKLYLSATGINDRREAAIVEIDPKRKSVRFFKHFPGWTGTLAIAEGKVWCTFSAKVVYNTAGQEWHLHENPWFIGKIEDTLFLTTGGQWRGRGPSHLYVFNSANRQFEKKLDFPDTEPWYICYGGAPGTYYFVTRNQAGNLGRVYKITRS